MHRKQLGGLTGGQIFGISFGALLLIGLIVGAVLLMTNNTEEPVETPASAADNPETCQRKIDCAPGFICSRAGECFPGCEDKADCPTGEECVQGQCATPEGTQSVSLKGTQWEDAEWTPGSGEYSEIAGSGYVRKFRGNIGDNVEMKFTLKESATDLCAPAASPVVAFGEVKIKNDEGVGVEWTYLKNDSHSSDYEPWDCCWRRGDNVDWNMKYLGNARNNPTYDSGLKSVFTPEEAGKMLSKTILDVRECPASPWEECPEGYMPYGKVGDQFCCKGTLSPTGSTCDGEVCAQITKNHQGAPWCSTTKTWYPDACPPGLNPYGGAQSQFCCSADPGESGTCYPSEYSCANKTSNAQGKPWCETNPNYRPKMMVMYGKGSDKYCIDTLEGVICNTTAAQATPFEVREYPATPEGLIPFAMKSTRSNKWCLGGPTKLVCDSTTPGKNHLFYRKSVEGDIHSIKPVGGFYCSDEAGRVGVRCNRGGVGGWEKFQLGFTTGAAKGGPSGNPVVSQ